MVMGGGVECFFARKVVASTGSGRGVIGFSATMVVEHSSTTYGVHSGEGIGIAILFVGAIEDSKLVWLQRQAPARETCFVVLQPIKPLQCSVVCLDSSRVRTL